jgi:hypothetical protein
VRRGFVNVIDAFHVVNQDEIPLRFYFDERKNQKGIAITDDLLRLKEGSQFGNLPWEVEARWRLVETAWSLGFAPRLLEVQHDPTTEQLFVRDSGLRRIDITSARASSVAPSPTQAGYRSSRCGSLEMCARAGTRSCVDEPPYPTHRVRPRLLRLSVI